MTTSMLRQVPLFETLSDEELRPLEEHAQVRVFPKQTLLINEGGDSNALYVVMEGKLKVFLSDEDGKEVILGIEGVGGYVGEIGLLDCEQRTASVMTMVRSKCLIVSRERFRACIDDNRDFAWRIIQELTGRIRALTGNVKNLALRNVYRRVRGVLMEMSRQDGEVRVLRERLTHQELADMVGASREMVSRIVRDLVTGGYISVENRVITIHRTPPSGW